MSRKDEILDALIEIFENKGIGQDFTISQLASKVNIGKSTIYEYFKTKDEILQQAIMRVIEKSIDQIFDKDDLGECTFEEAFKSEVRFLMDVAQNSSFMLKFISPEFKQLIPQEMKSIVMGKMKDVSSFYEQRFASIFEKGIQEGAVNLFEEGIKSVLVASLVTGSIIRFANVHLQVNKTIDLDDYIEEMFQAVLKILN